MQRFTVALFCAAFFILLFATRASAHAKLDKCLPEIAASVATAPAQVRCWFTEELDSKPIKFTVSDATGARVDNADGKLDLNDPDHKQVFATVKTLAAGVYRVDWQVTASDDKAITEGEWYFGIQVTAPTLSPQSIRTVAAPVATPSASAAPREIVTDSSRTFIFAAFVILAGAVIALVARQLSR